MVVGRGVILKDLAEISFVCFVYLRTEQHDQEKIQKRIKYPAYSCDFYVRSYTPFNLLLYMELSMLWQIVS